MKIGIIFGGKSYEHEISIVSSIVLKKVIKQELKFIFLDLDEEFYLIDEKDLIANHFSSGKYKKSKKISIDKNGFYYKTLFSKTHINCNMYINLIHGAYGEEGIASAFLDFYKQYYIGPRIEACAISYNKYMTKVYAKSINVKALEYETLFIDKPLKTSLNFPLIIKPLRGGSSMGINIANNIKELEYYSQEAFDYDDEIILEPYIKGVKEYNLAGYFSDSLHYSIIEEVKKGDILDFEQKYMDFSRDEKLEEANISKELKDKMHKAFKSIYANIFKGSIIRCDFFVIDNEVYINEINPIPGSMAHYLFDDFNRILDEMFYALPTKKNIEINYDYIQSINKAKG